MGSSAIFALAAMLTFAQLGSPDFVSLPPLEPGLAAETRPVIEETSLPWPSKAMPDEQVVDTDTLPGTSLNMSWLAKGGAGGFGSIDLGANHTWLLGYDDWAPLTITPGAGIHFWSGPAEIDLPPRVYDLYLDLQWRPIEREHWGLSVGLMPGWYGDFEIWDERTFQLTGWVLGNYRFNERWNIVGGVAYVRQLRNNILPVGGIVWTPNDDTRLELLIPKPKLARRIKTTATGSTWWYLAGELNGGTWAVADSPDTNVSLTYTDLRVLLGLEAFHHNGVQGSLELGYVFSRSIDVDDVVVYEPQDTFLLQATLAF